MGELHSSFSLLQGQCIGRASGTNGKDDKRIKYFLLENYFVRQLEKLRVGETIILKMIFLYWVGIYEVNLSGRVYEKLVGFTETIMNIQIE
jgi:hypothetical protein